MLSLFRPPAARHMPKPDLVHEPFFKAGIALALTLGALWGAWILIRMGLTGSFTSVAIHEVNAHGHAQIFGWVGLFVMGFAYQGVPRFKATSLAHPRLARATLGLMLGGILLRSGAQAFLNAAPALLPVGLAGSLLEITAIALFACIIIRTLRRSPEPRTPSDAYITAAIGWFLLQAVYGAVYFAAIALAPTRDALLGLVATWQAPLRDMQIHGFILLMTLGVSQRILPEFYGFPKARPRRAAIALVCLNVAVALEVAGLILMRGVGHAWAGVWYLGALLLAASVVALVADLGLRRRSPRPDRSLKYLRTAYVWLLLSLAMLIALPAYQFGLLPRLAPQSEAVAIGFSHAYYGAIRHAITVGFVSLLILGVAARVAPERRGLDVQRLAPLWTPYVLLNLGCALRVVLQTLTDFNHAAFPIAGVSGLLEVVALAVWGAHMLAVMTNRAGVAAHHAAPIDRSSMRAGRFWRPDASVTTTK